MAKGIEEGGPVTVNIVVTNVWTDDNKGDSAIVLATLRLLQERFGAPRFTLLSEISDEDISQLRAYRHLTAEFPQVSILPNPAHIPFSVPRSLSWTTACWLLRFGWQILQGGVVLMLAWLTHAGGLVEACAGPHRPWVRSLREADLVVSKGGGFLFHSRGMRSLIHIFGRVYPLLLAVGLRRRVLLFSQSIWGVHTWPVKQLIRPLLARVDDMWVREPITAEYLRCHFGLTRVRVVPDAAFAFPADSTSPRVLSLAHRWPVGSPVVGVTVRVWGSRSSPVYKRYLVAIAKSLIWLIESKLETTIVVIAHTIGPTDQGDDRLATNDLVSLLPRKVLKRVFVVDEDLSPRELKSLYGKLDLLIGTRFHSVIFATSMGVPSLAISYHGPKAEGIMRMLGQEMFVLPYNSVTANSIIRRVDRLCKLTATAREALQKKTAGYSDAIRAALADLKENLVSGKERYYGC